MKRQDFPNVCCLTVQCSKCNEEKESHGKFCKFIVKRKFLSSLYNGRFSYEKKFAFNDFRVIWIFTIFENNIKLILRENELGIVKMRVSRFKMNELRYDSFCTRLQLQLKILDDFSSSIWNFPIVSPLNVLINFKYSIIRIFSNIQFNVRVKYLTSVWFLQGFRCKGGKEKSQR